MKEEILYHIYSIIEEIPEGYVTTYGDIARLIGKERCSRMVGRALKISSMYGGFPCHRVVNHNGRTTPGWDEQITLLKQEGITFKDNNHVDMKKHKWHIDIS